MSSDVSTSRACSASGSTSPSPSQASDGNDKITEYAPSPSLLAAYDSLMASALPALSLPLPPPISVPSPSPPPAEDPDRPLSKAERQNAKKKRRKERERALKAAAAAAKGEAPAHAAPAEAEAVPFRLLGAVAPISLSTVESYELTPNPRVRPLPPAVVQRIRRIAAESAVTAPDPPPVLNKEPEVGVWRAERAPPVFLAYAAPVEHKCVAVPALRLCREIEVDEKEREKEERRVARRAKRRRAFPPAQYWTPPEGVVTRGYGYGYGL
ncbi:hypothetical protein CC85DRAFT_289103 [Cutaneotrichosporon oleaginosum]|uniref:Uncharacterized protein n=1 Tax=Cutaneotrichosporon oleaginosum TaxID=879819 RepID=A0A0J1AUG0_9TREE|nr:uncharacterized protein CC85DRAFT_289103 [Cutaneotrichosporon oleaginosum]KLT38909.1 hypothetical protein CC85DRAFT_289103 [Cutaneotrichosporon oleaginosum]TXT10390.1 hypothetical protein COLE_04324 [Cutaneotrichosporon oleaginosum]